ncbi:hypothetical protein BCR32DRAFT_288988 [Anaeromyces robustus]|uniref:Ras-GAP domain-containing protein n=1 Tax=Anaeromyces robustus TaxID=1754192 RepID=A0A1Y1XQ38_9FUNG|nr:hypothetical protein BCR32DRAFT_288988 [Anaeromyces robustus]|eukprot:ORX87869.1 hypothetical protein BCR32DRAFT_288988 [Anaeromyces robustus]
MENIHDFENPDLAKNDLLLKDIDDMITKLNNKRRAPPSNYRTSRKMNYSTNFYNIEKSPKFKPSYNFNDFDSYNSYRQKFHEYSVINREHQHDIRKIKNFHKMDRCLSNYEKRKIDDTKIPFYPRSNSSYSIKNSMYYDNVNNSPYRASNYYNKNDSFYNMNILNTEYSQDYYPKYLSESNKATSDYHDLNNKDIDINDKNNNKMNFNYNIYYPHNNHYYDNIERNKKINDENYENNIKPWNNNRSNPIYSNSYSEYSPKNNNLIDNIKINIKTTNNNDNNDYEKYINIKNNRNNKKRMNKKYNSNDSLDNALNDSIFIKSDEFHNDIEKSDDETNSIDEIDIKKLLNDIKHLYKTNYIINEKKMNNDNNTKIHLNDNMINDNQLNNVNIGDKISNNSNNKYNNNNNNNNNIKINNENDEYQIDNDNNYKTINENELINKNFDNKKLYNYKIYNSNNKYIDDDNNDNSSDKYIDNNNNNNSKIYDNNIKVNITENQKNTYENGYTLSNYLNDNGKNENVNINMKINNSNVSMDDAEYININNNKSNTNINNDNENSNNKDKILYEKSTFKIHERIISDFVSDTSSDMHGHEILYKNSLKENLMNEKNNLYKNDINNSTRKNSNILTEENIKNYSDNYKYSSPIKENDHFNTINEKYNSSLYHTPENNFIPNNVNNNNNIYYCSSNKENKFEMDVENNNCYNTPKMNFSTKGDEIKSPDYHISNINELNINNDIDDYHTPKTEKINMNIEKPPLVKKNIFMENSPNNKKENKNTNTINMKSNEKELNNIKISNDKSNDLYNEELSNINNNKIIQNNHEEINYDINTNEERNKISFCVNNKENEKEKNISKSMDNIDESNIENNNIKIANNNIPIDIESFEKKDIPIDETTSIVLNEASLDNSYYELENEKIIDKNSVNNFNIKSINEEMISPSKKSNIKNNEITISEITTTEPIKLNTNTNIKLKTNDNNSQENKDDNQKSKNDNNNQENNNNNQKSKNDNNIKTNDHFNNKPMKTNSLLYKLENDKNSKRIPIFIKNKDNINNNLNYLKNLFNSDIMNNKSFNLKDNDINNNKDEIKTKDEKKSSELLQKKRQDKLLNDENQQNILNAFTKVNEFKNKIITRKYIINVEDEDEEEMVYTLKTTKENPESPEIIINDEFTQMVHSPVPFDDNINNNNDNNINKATSGVDLLENDIPLNINIMDLKNPELPEDKKEKEELFLDSLEIITDILRSSLHNRQSEEWEIFDNKEFTIDHRLIVIKKLIIIRENRINEIKNLKTCFDIDCNLNRCKEIIKRILKNKKMDKYSVGELGMTLLNLIRFYPQNFIPKVLFKTYFSTTFGNYDSTSIFHEFNEKEKEIWDKIISHFSKILKQSYASSWSFYLSNILGWILTPRSLINSGDPISRNQIGKDLEKINKTKFTEDITLELKEILFCRNIEMVYNMFNLCSNTEQIKINSKALLYAFITESDSIYIMEEAIKSEIEHCDNINNIFIAETMVSNLLTEYLRLEGKSYLESFATTVTKYLIKKNSLYEIDMYKEASKAKIKKGYKNFTILINELFEQFKCIFKSTPLRINYILQKIYHEVNKKFDNEGHIIVSRIIIKLFICQALKNPKDYLKSYNVNVINNKDKIHHSFKHLSHIFNNLTLNIPMDEKYKKFNKFSETYNQFTKIIHIEIEKIKPITLEEALLKNYTEYVINKSTLDIIKMQLPDSLQILHKYIKHYYNEIQDYLLNIPVDNIQIWTKIPNVS